MNKILELSADDLDEVSGGVKDHSSPGHPSTGPTFPIDPEQGSVVFGGPVVFAF